jgi:lysophospholipase L1-like esterase
MNKRNFIYHPLIIVAFIAIVFSCASFFQNSFFVFGYTTKQINFLNDVLSFKKIKNTPLPQIILTKQIKEKDSVEIFTRKIAEDNIVDYPLDSGNTSLSHFFESLIKIKKKSGKTRIAYFGDSMIEGDLITQDFRTLMQNKFGGNGVGYMPITSIVAGFRTSIHHSFGEFFTYNLTQENSNKFPLGISGYSFVPKIIEQNNTASWVKYAAVNHSHLNTFEEISILFGKSNGENNVTINQTKHELNGERSVNIITQKFEPPVSSVNLNFYCPLPPTLFGCLLESSNGVIVDNFSFRGNSGLGINKTTDEVLQQTHQILNYDLIILEYGLNALSPKVTDFSWYQTGMDNTLKKIKRCFPNSSILIISVGDKSYSTNEGYQTDPSVPLMVESQKQLAQKNKIAFWSLYDAIGGEGTMVKWVQCDTPLANKDYTHLNFRGAKKVGKLLFEKLMSELKDYVKQKNKN